VLAVDDAHLLDPASATLVQQVAATGGVFVLATARTGERVPDAIVSLWKDGVAERIDVEALTEPEVAAILEAALSGEVEAATTHRLWVATGGNGLFLHELLLGGIRTRAFDRRDGIWSWRGPLTGDGTLRDVVELRLAPLGRRERAALELLAVGEPLGIDVFERMVGIDLVDDLERQELVRVWRDERREEASLFHPLYRDLIREAMSAGRLADAQGQLAEAVEQAGGRRRGDLLRVALWRIAGPADARPEILLAAAAEAEARFDAELAERLARAAVDQDGGSHAWHALGSALRAQGRNREADDAWDAALARESDPAERVWLAQSRSANLFFGLGEGARAVAVLDSVIPDATTQGLRDTIGSLVGMFDLYRGRIDSALAAAMPILDRGNVKADARIDAALTAAAALALRGRPTDAIAVVDDNLAAALQQPDVSSISAGALMATRLMALMLDGRTNDALVGARIVYELAIDMGTHDGIAGLSFAIGQIHESQGDIDTARRRLSESAALLRVHDRNGYLPWALAELAYTHIVAGDIAQARASVAELDHVARPELRLFQPRVDAAKLLLLGIDEPEAAVAGMVTAGESAVADGHLVLGAMTLHEAIRFGGAAAVSEILNRLAVSTDSALVRAMASHARAAAADDGDALDAVSLQLESIGLLLVAAESAAAAARAHEVDGRNVQRTASAHRAATLLGRCPGAAPPWLQDWTPTEPLSAREREVAELAAGGMTSREIAESLYVSVRTVDNHLYRAYAKLGVDSREELAIVLGSAPPEQ
jgi:DNA-binding CsgD family transcriptional regulator/tetratricopeptide (TPR) repeat protein